MSLIASPPLNTLQLRVGRAVAWWLGELRSLWFDSVRRLGVVAGRRLTIEAGEQCWIVRGRGSPLGEIPRCDDDTAARLRRLAMPEGREPAVTVAIPPERALSKLVDLPPGAAGELDRILQFEIARHFPFPAERMFYRYRIASRSPLKVEIVAVPRDLVASIIGELAAAGLRPNAVALIGGDAAPLFLPQDAVSPSVKQSLRPRLGALVGVLAVIATASWPLAQQVRLAAIEREITALKPAAEAALRARADARRNAERDADIARLRGGRAPLIALVDTLTRELPDGSWLTSLSITGHELLLEGLTPSAATIALALGRNPNFNAVVFRSPIARDAATGLEHFQLGATIEGRR